MNESVTLLDAVLVCLLLLLFLLLFVLFCCFFVFCYCCFCVSLLDFVATKSTKLHEKAFLPGIRKLRVTLQLFLCFSPYKSAKR